MKSKHARARAAALLRRVASAYEAQLPRSCDNARLSLTCDRFDRCLDSRTAWVRGGAAFCADSRDWLPTLEDASVALAITSPPFALLRPKAYGNEVEDAYLEWLLGFARALRPKLAEDGSFVIDMGGAYQRGTPSRTLVQWKFLIRVVEEHGYSLAQECYWHNPSKLPSPFEWVNIR